MSKRKASTETSSYEPQRKRKKLSSSSSSETTSESIIGEKISSTKLLRLSEVACTANFKIKDGEFCGIFFKNEHKELVMNQYHGIMQDPFSNHVSNDGASYDFYRLMVLFDIDKLQKMDETQESKLSFDGSVVSEFSTNNICFIHCSIILNGKPGPSHLIDFGHDKLIKRVFGVLRKSQSDKNDKNDKNIKNKKDLKNKFNLKIGANILLKDEKSKKKSFLFMRLDSIYGHKHKLIEVGTDNPAIKMVNLYHHKQWSLVEGIKMDEIELNAFVATDHRFENGKLRQWPHYYRGHIIKKVENKEDVFDDVVTEFEDDERWTVPQHYVFKISPQSSCCVTDCDAF